MRRIAAAMLLAMLVLGAAPLPRSRAQTPSLPSPVLGNPVAEGAQLYAVHCATCHGPAGAGTPEGPPLRGIGPGPVDFMLSTGRMPLRDPNQPTLRQAPRFSPAQIAAVVDYVASLGPGGIPVPAVQPEQGDLVRGEQMFVANCAPCHGAAGQGNAVGEGLIAPNLDAANAVQIAEAIRTGPPPMPKFGPEILSASDLNSVVRYVLALRSIPDRGGFGLGHGGPVIEGFIAWLVGMGILVGVARMIGTTG